MTTGPTPQQREQLQNLEILRQRIQHVHGLVERLAAEKGENDLHSSAIRRALAQLKLQFSGHGYAALAQTTGAMELAARRGSQRQTKAKQLREGVGTLRTQLDTEHRVLLAEVRRNVEEPVEKKEE
jgi:hypothetical protein